MPSLNVFLTTRATYAASALATIATLAIAHPAGADASAVPFSARHWNAGSAISAAGPRTLECLETTGDGALTAWRRGHTLEATRLAPPAPAPVALSGEQTGCPSLAADASGSLIAVEAASDERVLLARGTAGSPFTPLSSFGEGRLAGDGARDASRAGALAQGGGAIAVGVQRTQGTGTVPELLLRRATDPGAAPIALPGGAAAVTPVGPLVGLDGSGRGLVVWGAGGRLLAATLAADGTLGAMQVLAPAGSDALAPVRVAVGADGRAAVAWVVKGELSVATASTTAGVELAGAARTPVSDYVAIEPDSAAIAATARDSSDGQHGRVQITSRAPGGGFGVPVRYVTKSGIGDLPVALGLSGRRAVAAFTPAPSEGSPQLDALVALAGVPGGLPSRALPVPVASGDVTEVAVVPRPGAAPAVLAIVNRSIDSLAQGIHHERAEIDSYRLVPGTTPTAKHVRLRVARVQRLGHPQSLRLTVRCPARCSIRVAGAVGLLGSFDTALALPGGRAHQPRARALRERRRLDGRASAAPRPARHRADRGRHARRRAAPHAPGAPAAVTCPDGGCRLAGRHLPG